MSYFKTHRPRTITRPNAGKILQAQFGLTIALSLLAIFFSGLVAVSIFLGGLVSIAGQAFYNYRALRNFGSRFAEQVISTTFSAMYGKWAIIITASLIIVLKTKELNVGAFYLSLFIVHTLGALLLPVFVKK